MENVRGDPGASRQQHAASTTGRLTQTLRRIHRWVALVLAVFMAMIGLTGSILQAIVAVYGDPSGPGDTYPAAAHVPGWAMTLQHVVLQIHTGFFAGMTGTYYGMACGLGLLFFSVSGLWMFVQMYRQRFRRGGRSLFWSDGATARVSARALHRWLAVGLGLFALLVSFTGTSLDFDFARHHMIPMIPGAPPQGATAVTPPAPSPSDMRWHSLNFSVHKLDFLGLPGHCLGIVLGAGLATFAITGLWMYLSMRRRRVQAGRQGLFW